MAHLQHAVAPDGLCDLWLTGYPAGIGQPETPAVWRSNDAGVHLETLANLPVAWVDSIAFSSTRDGWIAGPASISTDGQAGEETLVHTSDGGVTWTIVALTTPAAARLSSLNLVSSPDRVLIGALYQPADSPFPGGIILESEDSGKTWREAARLDPIEQRDSGFTQIQLRGATAVVEGFQAGKPMLEISHDGGRSFAPLQAPSNSYEVSLVDAQHMYVVSGQYVGPHILFRSDDAGRSWTRVATSDRGFGSLHFVSVSRGYSLFDAGQVGTALRVTADGGRSWHDVTIVPEGMIAGEVGGVVMGLTIAPDGTAYVVCSDALYRGRL
jgi:photosystem II stability/assembly factor-like uncharacterized protein